MSDDTDALTEAAQIAQQFYATTRRNIEQYGHSLIAVANKKMPFAYTIGNAQKQLPELLILAVSFDQARILLNLVGDQMRAENRAFKHGERVSLGKHAVKLVEADPVVKVNFTIQVGRYYGREDYRVLQILIPDEQGLFPGNKECKPPYSEMPVLSARYWEEIGVERLKPRILRPN